jgi:Tol biopolymer transport system component
MRRLSILISAGLAGPLLAQAPPGTDVYLAPLSVRGATVTIGPAQNLTRRPGYDNQPSFSPDGKQLYYTVVREGGPKGTTQADIFRVDLRTRATAAFIATPESEYSAAVIPGGREVSVIRVELDSTQRLWAFPIAGGGAPRILAERVKPVGYQTWLDASTVGAFVLGSPATLQRLDLETGDATILLSNIGRALQRVPGRRAISVTHRVSETEWWIVEVDPTTALRTPIVKMPDQADYFVWLSDGSLLTASGSRFLRYRPGTDSAWRVVATLEGISGITRLAVNGKNDRIAFVAEDSK